MPVAAYFAIAGAIVVGALWHAIAAFLWNRSERFGIDAFVDPYVQLAIAPTVICYGAAVGIGMRRYIPDQSLALALYASGARIYLTTLIITLLFFPIGTVLAVLAGAFLLCGPVEEYLDVTFYPRKLSWLRDR